MTFAYTLRDIAPPLAGRRFAHDGEVWLLNLDHVEPHTGRLLEKMKVPISAVGGSTQAFDSGNVLYSKLRPYLNKVYLPEECGYCTSEFVPLRPRADLVTRDYLAAYLRSDRFLSWVKNQVAGAKMPRVSMKAFWEHSIELPSLAEQSRITEILKKVEIVRHKRQQTICKAEMFLRAVFLDMFGDPLKNPKGWSQKRICEVGLVATGGTPRRDKKKYFDGSVPWVKTGEVENDWIVETEEHVSEQALRETNCKMFPERTILLAMYGQGKTRGKVGMLGIAASTNQACAAILPSTEVAPEFVLDQLKIRYQEIREMGRGGNQENLNLSMVKEISIVLPSAEEVKRYLAIREMVKSAQDLRRDSMRSIEKLRRSFQSLLG